MWAQIEQVLGQAFTQIGNHVANFLPGVLVSLTLILATLATALFVRLLLARSLRGLEFDRHVDQWGVMGLLGWSSMASPSLVVSRVVYWTILVLGLLVSLTALNATIPSQLALSVFEYLPHLLAALTILIGGAIAARFLARSVLIGAVNMRLQSARLLSLAIKGLVLLVTFAMALDHLGIGGSILPLAFGIVLGGIVLAASLALGLGARDLVGRALERELREPTRGGDDKLDHV
jgi:hypothetical protein